MRPRLCPARKKSLRKAFVRSCGPTDKASDYESGDSRFESWQDRIDALEINAYNVTQNIPLKVPWKKSHRPCGLTDKASDFESEDSRFES